MLKYNALIWCFSFLKINNPLFDYTHNGPVLMFFPLHNVPAIGTLQNVYALECWHSKGPNLKHESVCSLTVVGPLPDTSVFAGPIWLAKLLNFSPNLLRLLLSIFITRILYVRSPTLRIRNVIYKRTRAKQKAKGWGLECHKTLPRKAATSSRARKMMAGNLSRRKAKEQRVHSSHQI